MCTTDMGHVLKQCIPTAFTTVGAYAILDCDVGVGEVLQIRKSDLRGRSS